MNSLLLFFSFGGTEIFLIVFVILLLFGAKRIPDLAKGIGSGIREFKKASKEDSSEQDSDKKRDKNAENNGN